MPRRTLTEQVRELPSEQKAVFWGSVAMVVSVILPWYSDIDAFRTGDTYYGITGPLYLVGLLFFGLGGVMAASLLHYGVRDKIEQIFSKLSNFYLMAGGFCLFLLLLANSVYFHPKFGVNISIKESRFGMILALVGVVAVFVGGYVLRKRQVRYSQHSESSSEPKLEPLVTMPEREHGEVSTDDVRRAGDVRQDTAGRQNAMGQQDTTGGQGAMGRPHPTEHYGNIRENTMRQDSLL